MILYWSYLGLVPYREALSLQQRIRTAILEGQTADTLLLLEHPRVITMGRSGKMEHLLASPEDLSNRQIELVRVSRGGDLTYHGPGQLVGYPLRRIGRSIKKHVTIMAESIIGLLKELSIDAWWSDEHPGVWTQEGKIAAVGVDARGGVAMHGFSLNVSPDLEDYKLLVPCGYQAPVTSIKAILGEAPELEKIAHTLAMNLALSFKQDPEELSPPAIWDKF